MNTSRGTPIERNSLINFSLPLIIFLSFLVSKLGTKLSSPYLVNPFHKPSYIIQQKFPAVNPNSFAKYTTIPLLSYTYSLIPHIQKIRLSYCSYLQIPKHISILFSYKISPLGKQSLQLLQQL